ASWGFHRATASTSPVSATTSECFFRDSRCVVMAQLSGAQTALTIPDSAPREVRYRCSFGPIRNNDRPLHGSAANRTDHLRRSHRRLCLLLSRAGPAAVGARRTGAGVGLPGCAVPGLSAPPVLARAEVEAAQAGGIRQPVRRLDALRRLVRLLRLRAG